MDKQFKTRYFNEIKYDATADALCKSSSNVEKLKAEYEFFQQLPVDLRHYFVDPFGYEESNGRAKYFIKEVDADDAAKQFISGEATYEWYDGLMSKVSEFLDASPSESVSQLEFSDESYNLVVGKSRDRVALLEADLRWVNSPYRTELAAIGITAESLVDRLEIAFKFFIRDKQSWVRRLSHGDLCLSNILWSEQTGTFKLIDPKGVESMHLDEYYDVAKLCHSITGNYDDIVYGNYELDYENKTVKITRQEDEYYWDTFRQWVIARKLSFELVRVYETSIFISMLVNHLEDEKRVAAFMLNASRHLETLSV